MRVLAILVALGCGSMTQAERCASPPAALGRLPQPAWFPRPEHFAGGQCPDGACDWPPRIDESSPCQILEERDLDAEDPATVDI